MKMSSSARACFRSGRTTVADKNVINSYTVVFTGERHESRDGDLSKKRNKRKKHDDSYAHGRVPERRACVIVVRVTRVHLRENRFSHESDVRIVSACCNDMTCVHDARNGDNAAARQRPAAVRCVVRVSERNGQTRRRKSVERRVVHR